MKARLIACTVPGAAGSKDFYEALLGVKLGTAVARDPWPYAWASAGVKLTVGGEGWAGYGPMLSFAVDALDEATQTLMAAGGEVLQEGLQMTVPPDLFEAYAARYEEVGLGVAASVTDRLGTLTVIRDPGGSLIGLVQLEPYAEVFFEAGQLSSRDLNLHSAEVSFWNARI